jgi:multisubunit Na+/H+ antiporter MnhF subunit
MAGWIRPARQGRILIAGSDVRLACNESEADMNEVTPNPNRKLSGQDWFWIAFIAIIGALGTFGGFVVFLPAYVIALLIGYVATRQFPKFFDRTKRTLFVLKVLAIVIPVFALLCLLELALIPSVYKP